MKHNNNQDAHPHFQSMSEETKRQWKDYYMANGEWEMVSAIENHDYRQKRTTKKTKAKKPNMNAKKMQRKRLDEVKQQERLLREALLGCLEPSTVVRIESYTYPLLRRMNRSQPKEDIAKATGLILEKLKQSAIEIEPQLIETYLTKRIAILKKYPFRIKKKKKTSL